MKIFRVLIQIRLNPNAEKEKRRPAMIELGSGGSETLLCPTGTSSNLSHVVELPVCEECKFLFGKLAERVVGRHMRVFLMVGGGEWWLRAVPPWRGARARASNVPFNPEKHLRWQVVGHVMFTQKLSKISPILSQQARLKSAWHQSRSLIFLCLALALPYPKVRQLPCPCPCPWFLKRIGLCPVSF